VNSVQEVCKQDAGVFVPEVNLKKCEGKADCLTACPYHVFEVRPIDDEDKQALNLLQRFKLSIHGGKVAYAVNADQCRACGDCVAACPEKAITLVRAKAG